MVADQHTLGFKRKGPELFITFKVTSRPSGKALDQADSGTRVNTSSVSTSRGAVEVQKILAFSFKWSDLVGGRRFDSESD